MNASESRISQNNPLIEKIMLIQDPSVQKSVKDRVKQRLLQEAEILLEKKKREQQKKQRIKQLEQNLQKKRQQKLKNMELKNNKSNKVMEQNKEVVNRKLKQQQNYYKQIINKIEDKQKHYITEALNRQKQIETSYAKSVQKIAKSISHTTLDASSNNTKYQLGGKVEEMLEKIQVKAQKALQKHGIQKKLVVDRLRQKSENIANVQQKASNLNQNDEEQAIKNWTKKTQSIEMIHENVKSQRQKKIIQRKRSIKYKFEKCSQNLRNLSYRQEERCIELNNKFNRKYEPKEWKNEKLEKYWRIWEDNSKRIFQQKIEDGQKIINKHQQITDQNKIYKERKQKLLQAMKSI